MYKSLFIAVVALVLASCSSDPNHTGRTFVPDMQYTPAYEPYAQTINGRDTLNNSRLKPVKGTIARGEVVYHIPNTQEGFEMSASVVNPIEKTDKVLKEGKELYINYCMICHGKKGDGNGTLPASEKYPVQPPAYKPELADGTIFHVITYGKGMMGSHAPQIFPEDRWKIVHYIQTLKGKK